MYFLPLRGQVGTNPQEDGAGVVAGGLGGISGFVSFEEGGLSGGSGAGSFPGGGSLFDLTKHVPSKRRNSRAQPVKKKRNL